MEAGESSVELPGSERQILAGARRTGPTDRHEIAEVTVVLRRGSRAGPPPSLEELGRRPLRNRTHLTREEFAAAHGARAEDLEVVRSFTKSRGLNIVAEDPARRSVRISGTVESLASAFGVVLESYAYPGGTYRGRLGPIRLPPDLRSCVIAVLGLDNRPQAKTHFRVRPASASASTSYTPLEVGDAYSFPADADGTGQVIGLIELGGGYRPSDLSLYFQGLVVPAPQVTAISVDGATNAPTGSADGPDGEVELDVEVSGALAPGAQIAVYFAPNTDQGFLDAVATAVHDTTLRPTIISISWGGPEESWTAQARTAFESIFEDAANLGVTILVAAGDNGADDGGPGAGLSVDYPASSPGVVACGGTRLELSGAAIGSEVVWNELAAGEGATGGGVSVTFPLPSYQSGVGVPVAPNGFVGRGVPDVAGDADPTSGYQVLVDGARTVIGGTSAVAPLWAALIARINQLLGSPVGFVNPHLYAVVASGAFRAITSGNNGGYSAGPGWNACAGLGSPEGTALESALRGA